jgi:hypothetical protein
VRDGFSGSGHPEHRRERGETTHLHGFRRTSIVAISRSVDPDEATAGNDILLMDGSDE